MNVVELMRKCVALCRLQQLPDTSPTPPPLSILNGGKRDNKLQRQVDERYGHCSQNPSVMCNLCVD